jgi:uncharacterized protein YjiS (DUF1127 family)
MTSYAPPAALESAGPGTAARAMPRLRAGLTSLVLRLLRWQELARERRALAAMDDHMLKDIGLTRADAAREAGRWFWDDGGEPWRTW